jgi:prepilin-type N-terminal cleavage/methylation domain-containing protein
LNFIQRHITAFTLMETIAVLAIVAVLAGITGLSLHGATQRVTSESVQHRLVEIDAQARRLAERFHEPMLLLLDRTGVVVQAADRQRRREIMPVRLRLPDGYELEPIGARQLTVMPSGRSASYGLQLLGPGRSSRWLVVLGAIGQTHWVTEEQKAKALLLLMEGEDERPS